MPTKKTDKNWVVFLSTYPPRECGIAAYTEDLSGAFDELFAVKIESKVVAMNSDKVNRLNYPGKVIYNIDQSNPGDYIGAAKTINQTEEIKLINIQHEFGIYGGAWGENLLSFMENAEKPIITTFHSVLPKPEAKVKQVVGRIAARSFLVVVMTLASQKILVENYGVSRKKIRVIPHGIHPMPFASAEKAKHLLGLEGRAVLSTFGLLSRDKGLEYVLDALPEVVKKIPDALYLIIGATHPIVLKKDGERYRNFLVKKVYDLKLTEHVKFYNRYLSVHELLEFLKATDIYLSTSQNPNQAVSGTLSYAMGAGRPVISTAFPQAKEDIPEKIGLLVNFRDSSGWKKAIIKLLRRPKLRASMSLRAYFLTRNMTWPNAAIAYMKVFTEARPAFADAEKNLPKIRLSHVMRMTDGFGMYQFAKLSDPDKTSGYTVDDNARALVAACLYYEKHKSNAALRLINIYLNFLKYTACPDGYFDNYVFENRKFNTKANKKENMENATGQALYALAYAAVSKPLPQSMRNEAVNLYFGCIKKNISFRFPRSSSLFIKSLALCLSAPPSLNSANNRKRMLNKLIINCNALNSMFKKNSRPDWRWFERELTYANAVIPEALIAAYIIRRRENPEWFETGKEALEFLISKTFLNNMFAPIGQKEWFRYGKKRSLYDQQPEEASVMIQALRTMYSATKDNKYRKLMRRVFYWYLGDNTRGQIMYDAATGGCYDGLGRSNINLNQGAESSLSYLIARLML